MAEKDLSGLSMSIASPSSTQVERPNTSRIVSMRLFASWEIDKTSPNCIPRLCMFSVTALKICEPLEIEDVNSIVLAVQMAGSKRVLRSGEIPLNPSPTETCLDISFSMQYPHFVKRDVNNLRVALQRRKKYKNRAFLGYKTLAGGTVNLSQVLQRPRDIKLNLVSTVSKDKNKVMATINLQNITSKPVSYDDGGKMASYAGADRSPESEDDDMDVDDDELYGEDSCSEEDLPRQTQQRDQRNFKQKIARLLNRFKNTDDAEKHLLKVLEQDSVTATEEANLDALFYELEDLSEESENEADTVSIQSTAKPGLRPYFKKAVSEDTIQGASNPSARNSDSESGIDKQESVWKCETAVEPLEDKVTSSDVTESVPVTESLDSLRDGGQMDKLFKGCAQQLPKVIYVVDLGGENNYYSVAHGLYQSLLATAPHCVLGVIEKDELQDLILKTTQAIHIFFNSNSRAPGPIKFVLLGNDCFIAKILQPFVKIFSEKTPEWLNHIRFLPLPLGASQLCKQLGALDPNYHELFCEGAWLRLLERSFFSNFMLSDNTEILDRLQKYIQGANTLVQHPLCEAMVALRGSTNQDESQQFVPFLTEISIGGQGLPSAPASPFVSAAESEELTPSSPRDMSSAVSVASDKVFTNSPPSSGGSEPCELQIEFWVPNKGDKSKPLSKESLKGCYKFVLVTPDRSAFNLVAVPRERRGKTLRIGKKLKEKEKLTEKLKEKEKQKDKNKDKDGDLKYAPIHRDGITRIVCTTRDQSDCLTVHIDQAEWQNVKFFQLSTQWQTHVKYLPICVSKSLAPIEP